MKIRFSFSRHHPLNSRMGRIATTIMVVSGLLICLFGLFDMYKYNQIEDDLVSVKARIERIDVTRKHDDTDYDVYVSYSYQGKEYQNIHLRWYSSSMKEGKSITLKIHPDDPAVPIGNHGALYLLAGGIMAVIGSALWVAARWSRLKERFRPNQTPQYG